MQCIDNLLELQVKALLWVSKPYDAFILNAFNLIMMMMTIIESTSSRTFSLQAMAIKALKLAGTASAKTLCHRMVQLGLTYEKSEEQGMLYSHQEQTK